MTAALDFGSSEFRSLRPGNSHVVARRIPASYAVIDDNSGHRKLLEQAGISYSVAGHSLVIVGEKAREVCAMLHCPIVPLFEEGELPQNDPVARQVCASLVEAVLPMSQQAQEICFITLPGKPSSNPLDARGTAQFLKHLVYLRGYQVETQHPATALALAELEDCGFTGAAIAIGSDSVNLSILSHSQVVLECRYANGSRDVIERFAHARKKYLWDAKGNSYLDTLSVESWLNQGGISVFPCHSEDEVWLANAYEELLLSALFSFRRKLVSCDHQVMKSPMSLVISGKACAHSGFTDLVIESFKLSGIPFTLSEIRLASLEPYSVARGLLIEATLTAGETPGSLTAIEAA